MGPRRTRGSGAANLQTDRTGRYGTNSGRANPFFHRSDLPCSKPCSSPSWRCCWHCRRRPGSPYLPYRRERRLLPIDKAGPFFGVTSRTMRSYAAKKFFPLYRMSGVRGVEVDLDEVTAAMRKVPARRAKAGLGSYGGVIRWAVKPSVIHPHRFSSTADLAARTFAAAVVRLAHIRRDKRRL